MHYLESVFIIFNRSLMVISKKIALLIISSLISAFSTASYCKDNIFKAAAKGNLARVNALIASGVNINEVKENWHDECECFKIAGYATPLNIAIHYDHIEIAKALIAAGAFVGSGASGEANLRVLPLFCAVLEGRIKFVKLLIASGANVNLTFPGASPLATAAHDGRLAIVQELILAGADVNKEQGVLGVTPLEAAAVSGHLDVARVLVAAGADINKTDYLGLTPLHMAAGRGHEEVVHMLIEAGAYVNNQSNNVAGSITPLHLAVKNGQIKTVEVLVAVSQINIDLLNSEGKTALDLAEQYNYEEIMCLLKKTRHSL